MHLNTIFDFDFSKEYFLLFVLISFVFLLWSGIEYLCENHLLQMDAQDIAHFLYKGEGLNKTAIGKGQTKWFICIVY